MITNCASISRDFMLAWGYHVQVASSTYGTARFKLDTRECSTRVFF